MVTARIIERTCRRFASLLEQLSTRRGKQRIVSPSVAVSTINDIIATMQLEASTVGDLDITIMSQAIIEQLEEMKNTLRLPQQARDHYLEAWNMLLTHAKDLGISPKSFKPFSPYYELLV
ncbi:hypothetical protein GF342_00020 [Candidatus Woesearchaeota archaeon]|nr:hypothetical protein [Candidatus Woesearchaeota archaeon]